MMRRKTISLFSSTKVRILLALIVVGIVGFGVYKLTNRSTSNASSSVASSQTKSADTKAMQTIDRDFSYPIKDSAGEEVSKLTFGVDTAEIRDQIVVKGKRLSAVEGRTFLILNLRIKNEYSKSIEINTRDYIRLAVNGDESQWLAPEVHNDPVSVQAISTKLTRVAFPVNNTDKKFILQIGEIQGDKERIELNLD